MDYILCILYTKAQQAVRTRGVVAPFSQGDIGSPPDVHEDPPSKPPAGCTQRSSPEAEANGRCCLRLSRLSYTMTVVTEKLRLGNSKMVSFIDWSLQHDMWHRQSKERRTVVALKQQQANLVAARAQNWQRVFYESHQCSWASASVDVFGTPLAVNQSHRCSAQRDLFFVSETHSVKAEMMQQRTELEVLLRQSLDDVKAEILRLLGGSGSGMRCEWTMHWCGDRKGESWERKGGSGCLDVCGVQSL